MIDYNTRDEKFFLRILNTIFVRKINPNKPSFF